MNRERGRRVRAGDAPSLSSQAVHPLGASSSFTVHFSRNKSPPGTSAQSVSCFIERRKARLDHFTSFFVVVVGTGMELLTLYLSGRA